MDIIKLNNEKYSNPGEGGYKLILASNRDEFYDRPTAKVQAWKDTPWVFGGYDLRPGKKGGTWLSISAKDGVFKFGALLNLKGEEFSPEFLARGSIVANYIKGDITNTEYCQKLLDSQKQYVAYNFISAEIYADNSNTMYLSNVPPTVLSFEEKKTHGFGNSLHSSPVRKVIYGKEQFSKILSEIEELNKTDIKAKLMQLLKSDQKHWPDEEWKRRAPTWGEHLSSIFVNVPNENYGTRTHTVILVDSKNQVDIFEETMTSQDPYGDWEHTHIGTSF